MSIVHESLHKLTLPQNWIWQEAICVVLSAGLAQRAPDKWESARFHLCLRHGAGRQFAWLEVGSVKTALSRPTHQPVTHTVRRLMKNQDIFSLENYEG